MSFFNTAKGMAIGAGAAVAIAATATLLVSARLADVDRQLAYHFERTYSAVRRIHTSLMQGDNYRLLFPAERADEIRSIATLVVTVMVQQIEPMYRQPSIDHALKNLIKICSEE